MVRKSKTATVQLKPTDFRKVEFEVMMSCRYFKVRCLQKFVRKIICEYHMSCAIMRTSIHA